MLPKNTTVVRLSTQHGAQPREQAAPSSAVHPAPSTHSSSGPIVPLVVTPTTYTQQPPVQEGTAYIIPARGGVGKGGQQVAYALPSAVVPQVPQQGRVHYILEAVDTAPVTSASVVCNTKIAAPVSESSLPVRNKNLQHGSGFYIQSSIPAEAGNNSKSLSGQVAKPYMVISSQPATPVEIRGIPVDQRVIPIASPQLSTQYSVVPGTQYIHSIKPSPESSEHPHTDTTAISVTKGYQPGTGGVYLSKAPVTVAAVKLDSSQQSNIYARHSAMECTPSTSGSVDLDIREIGKRIENAFASCNEDMLIAAFEDTWRKFQANGKKYDALNLAPYHPKSYVTRSPIPPNAEVIRVPGTSSRLSLVRPTNSRPKVAPKPAPEPTHIPSAQPAHPVVSQQPQQQTLQQVQYVYSYATKANQAQVYLKPLGSDYTLYSTPTSAQHPQVQQTQTQSQAPVQGQQQVHTAPKTYQVATSGVFYPTHTSENNSQVVLQPVSVLESQQALPKPAPSNLKLISERPALPQTTERFPTVQNHSVMRKIHLGTLPNAVLPRNPRKPSLSKVCVICMKEATYLCSGCKQAWYCGKDCQVCPNINTPCTICMILKY